MMIDCTSLRRTGGVAFVVLMMIPLFRGAAAAQQGDPPPAAARAHVGPVYLSPAIALRDVGVDSNVYNGPGEGSVSDFTFTVVPRLVATTGGRRALFTLRSTTDLVYFVEQSSERSANQDLVATGRFSFNRVSAFAEAGYLNTRQRPDNEIDARSRRIDRRGAVGVSIGLSPKISAELRGDYARMAFDANAIFDDTYLAQELNRETRTVAAGARYAATPLTEFVVSSDLARTRFTLAPVRDADSQQTLFGVDLAPRALISGSVRAGYQRFRPRNAALPDFDGLIGSADVAYRPRMSTTLGFSFSRNLSHSYFELEPYYVREGFGLSVRRQLVERWDVRMSGGQFWHRYRRTTSAAAATATSRSDALLDAAVELGYQKRPGTRLSVGLSYHDRRSEYEYRSYDGFRLGSSVVYGF